MNDLAEHDAQMVLQKKEFLKKAKSRKGQQPIPAMRRSRDELEQDFFTGAPSDPMGALISRRKTKISFVGEAYPPSIESIFNLTSITLRDLKLETHHRGRVLIARTFCEPMCISSMKYAIEDIQGNVDCLCIYNIPSASPMDRVLPKGAIIAVKEPYLEITADDGVAVRVDHPSDVILLDFHESLGPPHWRSEQVAMTGSQLEEEGNDAFRQGNWQKAAECYTAAVTKADNNEDLHLTLRRNRAQVYLNLGQYEFALEDAVASVIAGDNLPQQAIMLNVKSYLRAGRAQYQLGDFCIAKEYFDQALRLDPTDETVIADLARTKQRILEQQSGEFDFDAMAQSATASHKRLDHATFIKNTKIASAGERGRGLFATKDVEHGDIVMVEKAFCVVFEDELGEYRPFHINIGTGRDERGAHAECLYETIDKLRRNPSRASEFTDLCCDGGTFQGKQVTHVDGTVVVDAFQVQAISELNGFECPRIRSSLHDRKEGSEPSTGIWLRASYMNNSCIPNTNRAFIGDMLIVRAKCDIKAGEEIFTSYLSTWTTFPNRKKTFARWGFQCDCPLCRVESEVPDSVFTYREHLEQEASNFITANPKYQGELFTNVDVNKVAEAKEILRRLQATYDNSIYGTLPHLDCVSIELWLVRTAFFARVAESSDKKTLDIAPTTRVTQDLGYRVKVKGSEASIDRTNGVPCSEVVENAMYSQIAWHLAHKPEAATAFSELGREVYLGICGAMDGYEEISEMESLLEILEP